MVASSVLKRIAAWDQRDQRSPSEEQNQMAAFEEQEQVAALHK